jgi:hypothetical protein
LAKIPDDLRNEQVVLLSDIASTGISAAEWKYSNWRFRRRCKVPSASAPPPEPG